MILTTDIKELFDPSRRQVCCDVCTARLQSKRNYKMDGQKQTIIRKKKKNWSSVVLWNCGHKSNRKVTQDFVNDPEINGAYLHRFSWLKDKEIGELDPLGIILLVCMTTLKSLN